MFENATRLKLRFKTQKGLLSTEDLWDLSLSDLNKLAKSLNKKLKESEEVDFLEEKTKEDIKTKLEFDLVLHILNVKKQEKTNAEMLSIKKEKKEKILSILADKEDESLKNMSREELEKMLNEY